MRDYIRLRLRELKNLTQAEKLKGMEELYEDLEGRGMQHREIFKEINLTIAENLGIIERQLKQWKKDKTNE